MSVALLALDPLLAVQSPRAKVDLFAVGAVHAGRVARVTLLAEIDLPILDSAPQRFQSSTRSAEPVETPLFGRAFGWLASFFGAALLHLGRLRFAAPFCLEISNTLPDSLFLARLSRPAFVLAHRAFTSQALGVHSGAALGHSNTQTVSVCSKSAMLGHELGVGGWLRGTGKDYELGSHLERTFDRLHFQTKLFL